MSPGARVYQGGKVVGCAFLGGDGRAALGFTPAVLSLAPPSAAW